MLITALEAIETNANGQWNLDLIAKLARDAIDSVGTTTSGSESAAQASGGSSSRLIGIRELAKELQWISEASLRDLVYHSRERLSASGETIPANGFANCLVKLTAGAGKKGRLLIDRDAFQRWIDSHRVGERDKS